MKVEDLKRKFNSTEKLYHYTTFEKGIKILQSGFLLFGRQKDMNDINELHRMLTLSRSCNCVQENSDGLFDLMKSDFLKYQQISLVYDGTRRAHPGFDISAMWGHYADKGNGLCLVFDKNLLINMIKKKGQCVYKNVIYKKKYSPVIHYLISEKGDLKPLKRKEVKDYFFHKTKDWQYEQEYRIIIKTESDNREKLEFHDSLFAIVMHNTDSVDNEATIFDSDEYKILKRIKCDIPILEHNKWFDDTQLTLHEQTIWSSTTLKNVRWDL